MLGLGDGQNIEITMVKKYTIPVSVVMINFHHSPWGKFQGVMVMVSVLSPRTSTKRAAFIDSTFNYIGNRSDTNVFHGFHSDLKDFNFGDLVRSF